MFTTRRTLRENGATTVSMAAISALLLIGRVVTAMMSLEAKLFALSLLWVNLYQLQPYLVAKRRCSGHWLVQYGAMAAYYIPTPLAFYAASALCYSTSHVSESTPMLLFGILFMMWITIAVSSSGVIFTNMRAYSLRDRPGDCYSFLKWLVSIFFVEWGWARISSSNWRGPEHPLLLMFRYFVLVFYTLFVKTLDSPLDCQTKAVADYMKRESSKSSTSSPFFDDDDDDDDANSSLQLDCCRYPFSQRWRDGQWISIKDLFHQCRDLRNEDKDICLSYSLSRLLARRYYGFHCAEEGDDKVRRLALADLGTTDGYKRAFTIVEVQLAFLHDYFFTTSLPIIQLPRWLYGANNFGVMFGFAFTIRYFLAAILISIDELDKIQMLETALYGMLMLRLLLPIKYPVRGLLAAYWDPIDTAFGKLNCPSLPDPDFPRQLVGLVRLFSPLTSLHLQHLYAQDAFDPVQAQTGGAYWRNKIGQYSILQDYNRRRSPKKALVAWFHRIVLSQPSYGFINHLPVEEEEVDMLQLDNIRELVADTLRDIDGPPTNGTRSLKINMDQINRDEISRGSAGYDWLLTCKQETHTDTILIWHIATCYCDMSLRHCDQQEGFPRLADTDTFHEVTTTLSRYCAYLVAFLPGFLPEHSLTTKQVFQRVLQEAQGALGTTPIEEKEKHTKMRELPLPHQREQQTTFHKGVELGRQLEMIHDDKVRWRFIAEFWAETILYVAPSDNAEAHIEHLAKGGEFITHLWAMLSNAGIAKRATGEWHPPASTTKKGPPKKIETTKARTQECPF